MLHAQAEPWRRKMRLKNSFCQPARLKFRSRRASFGALPGLAASDFVRSVEADLLVVPLPKSSGMVQQLPSNIAWVSDVIPCNLWVIR